MNHMLILLQMGAYHTLDLEVNRKFTLTKSEWDSVALERVDTACDPTQVCMFQCFYHFNVDMFINKLSVNIFKCSIIRKTLKGRKQTKMEGGQSGTYLRQIIALFHPYMS